jgi:ubiquinone/menaquinone biosynthesis C-methylase UbiE
MLPGVRDGTVIITGIARGQQTPMNESTPKQFKDHFSNHADSYEAFRPNYPADLFEYLASIATGHELAWDCATGNGQAALGVAPYFKAVIATDASARQIEQARPGENVQYSVSPASDAPTSDASVDLVTVAQALHWFDLAAFYAEVRRVARPDGILAVWCYEMHSITPEVDAIVSRLYHDIVGSYWPPERKLVEDGYSTMAFPFKELTPPRFRMAEQWDFSRFLGYLGTWSSVKRYERAMGHDPVDLVRKELEVAWGDPAPTREVVWPLNLRAGFVGRDG